MSNLPLYEWEYNLITTSIYPCEKDFNKLGKNGWELVNFVKSGSYEITGIFKRPKLLDISLSLNDDKS